MKIRGLFAVLAVLLMCGLFLGVDGCSSVSEDVLGTGGTVGANGATDPDPDDEGNDEGDDEAELCPGVPDDVGMIDSVKVLAGETCTLEGRIVVNDITVGPGATLNAHGVSVGGDIFSDTGAMSIVVDQGSALRGSIVLALVGETTIDSTTVAGEINIKKNTGQTTLSNNEVFGDVLLLQNTGGVYVISNQITNTLNCEDNDPAPRGQDNTAASMEGQCQNSSESIQLQW